MRTINGQQALTATADFTDSKMGPMTEYLTWIYTPKTRAFFLLAPLRRRLLPSKVAWSN